MSCDLSVASSELSVASWFLRDRDFADRDGEHLIHFAKFAVVFGTGVTSFVYRKAQGLSCGGEKKFSWKGNTL